MKNLSYTSPTIQQFPCCGLLQTHRNQVDILRLDQVDPVVSGNKWFKLKHNIEMALANGYQSLLSCGGVHSNHLHALAQAGQYYQLKTHALVRGYPDVALTATLTDCQNMGMDIEFVNKKTYQQRYDSQWCLQQAQRLSSYWIPEGGNNELGIQGCGEIANACMNARKNYDQVWLSIGSGCTFKGIERVLPESIKLRGILAIKGGQSLAQELLGAAVYPNRCEFDFDSHYGGFGRCPSELQTLIHRYDELNLPLDPVYTAKLVAAFEQNWQQGLLPVNHNYLLIHTGGLQGRRGIDGL